MGARDSMDRRILARSSDAATAEEAYDRGMASISESNDWFTARVHFSKAVELAPENPVCWHALAASFSSTAPPDGTEEELGEHFDKMCRYFERAMDLADEKGGLSPEDYRKAAFGCSTIYKLRGRFFPALRAIRRGLAKVPDDTALLEGLTVCLFEGDGDLGEAEKAAERWLELEPGSPNARKLWKKIRKKAGKPLTIDRPEEERQHIYHEYTRYGAIGDMATGAELLDAIKSTDSIAEMGRAIGGRSARLEDSSIESIMKDFGLTRFEARQIVDEGKRNAWPVYSDETFRSGEPPPEKFRDSLRCQHCSKRNTAPFWPENGDSVPFYFQSGERTLEQPGAYRLPITCPFCERTWYVVWDENPDPLSGHLIRHIERISSAHASNHEALRIWRSMISDDILGKHMEFARSRALEVIHERQVVEHSIKDGDFYSTFTIVPASDPDEIRIRLDAPYTIYMNKILASADMDRLHTVHWLLGLGAVDALVHMLFFPRRADMPRIPTIVPTDLLTMEEKIQLGM